MHIKSMGVVAGNALEGKGAVRRRGGENGSAFPTFFREEMHDTSSSSVITST